MSWTVTINEQVNPIQCTVKHTGDARERGTVKKEIIGRNHPDLAGWTPPSDYKDTDAIVLVYLEHDPSGNNTTSTTFNLERDPNVEKNHIVVVPYDNTANGPVYVKGKGKRTSKKVSDELGGGH